MKIEKGFTMVELMVVVAIMAILVSLIAPSAFKAIEKGKISAFMRDYREIKTAAISYYADTSAWPANNNASVSLVCNDTVNGWHGPYLEGWPQHNPWKGNYTWCNDNIGVVATVGSGERYLEVVNVPSGSAAALDTNLDDGNLATGAVRYSAGNSTLHALVSADTE